VPDALLPGETPVLKVSVWYRLVQVPYPVHVVRHFGFMQDALLPHETPVPQCQTLVAPTAEADPVSTLSRVDMCVLCPTGLNAA